MKHRLGLAFLVAAILAGSAGLAAASTGDSGPAPLAAPANVTALSGRVLTTDGQPLANVAIRDGVVGTVTDANGQFLLAPAPDGGSIMAIDGRHAGAKGKDDYGYYESRVTAVSGLTTQLPFTSWLPKIDHAHEVRISSPTTSDVVVSTPLIPGLELHIPKGMVITDVDGKPVTKVGITPIPLDRTPFPLPTNVYVPIYFTAQPGSAKITSANGGYGYAQVYYPNYRHDLPGARGTFWKYDPDQFGWTTYGMGAVSANAAQVAPDPTTRIYELTGAMFNLGGGSPPATGPNPGSGSPGGNGDPGNPNGNPDSGDPVDLATGLFVRTQVDLRVADVVPLAVTRTYRQNDPNSREFGVGTTMSYNLFMHSTAQYDVVDLILPDGGLVHYSRTSACSGTSPPCSTWTDAVFATNTAPSAFFNSHVAWNGNGWNLTLQDGTVYVFADNAPVQYIQDRFGNRTTLIRAGGLKGNITQVTSPNGKFIQFTYTTINNKDVITQAKDNIGRTVTYAYGVGACTNCLHTVTDADNGVTTYGWDANARMTTIQSPRHNTFLTNQYYATSDIRNGLVQIQTFADTGTYQYAYTLDGTGTKIVETDVTDPRNRAGPENLDSGLSGFSA